MFDIRTPLGFLLAILGLLIAGYGLTSDPAEYQRSLGININLWWGTALLVFGAAMLLPAFRAWRARRGARAP
jgi:hypothetical protein